MILNFLASFIFYVFYFFWLGLSLCLAILGTLLPIKAKALESEDVKESDTICKVLFEKNKLTTEEYAFETNQVAVTYDDLVFRGYGFIVAPVIWILKRFDIIDHSILFFVHRWMLVHHHIFKFGEETDNNNEVQNRAHTKPAQFDLLFTKLCVAIAKGTGKSLSLFL